MNTDLLTLKIRNPDYIRLIAEHSAGFSDAV